MPTAKRKPAKPRPASSRCHNGRTHRWKTVIAGTDYFHAICTRCLRTGDFVLVGE